jgi:hypothetical protein
LLDPDRQELPGKRVCGEFTTYGPSVHPSGGPARQPLLPAPSELLRESPTLKSRLGESEELTIAVDGQRTRDVTDLDTVLEKAEAGEVIYLTVIHAGQREQIPVELPVGASCQSSLLKIWSVTTC